MMIYDSWVVQAMVGVVIGGVVVGGVVLWGLAIGGVVFGVQAMPCHHEVFALPYHARRYLG